MKAKLLGTTKENFKPITIELTIESLDELIALDMKINMPLAKVVRYFEDESDYPYTPSGVSTVPFWSTIRDELENHTKI
jgi:hypothetical protein